MITIYIIFTNVLKIVFAFSFTGMFHVGIISKIFKVFALEDFQVSIICLFLQLTHSLSTPQGQGRGFSHAE